MSRGVEFFEGDAGRLSMTRLLMFLSFFPASYVVIDNGGDAALGWYLSAYVFGYIGGKGADAMSKARPAAIISNAEVANVAVDKS